jgi:hypothetical protein
MPESHQGAREPGGRLLVLGASADPMVDTELRLQRRSETGTIVPTAYGMVFSE